MVKHSAPPIAVVVLLVALGEAALAQAPDYRSWSTADLYRNGTGLLKKGRSFQAAIDALAVAVERAPKDVDYRLALGCACADRFAAFAQARRQVESQEQDRKNYDFRRGAWEKAQSDPGHLAYGGPPPEPPAAPATPDDDRPFTLTATQSARLMRDLGRRSVAAFDEAGRLAMNLPAERRARAESVRGWGMFLLRNAAPDVVHDTPSGRSGDDSLCVPPAGVAACFRTCTELDPADPAHWQSLGISRVPMYLPARDDAVDWPAYMDGGEIRKPEDVALAVAAYRKALELKPGNFDLLYQLALIVHPGNVPLAVESLQRAAKRPGSNATVWYFLAGELFRVAEKESGAAAEAAKRKALAAIRAGNDSGAYKAPPFTIPVPAILARAWAFSHSTVLSLDGLVQEQLFTALRAHLTACAAEDKSAPALTAAELMDGLGEKLLSTFRRDDLFQPDSTVRGQMRLRAMIGVFDRTVAYQLIQKSQEQRPDDAKARYLTDRADAYQEAKQLDKLLSKVF